MAFERKNLGLLAQGNGFQLWTYSTADTAATVDTAGYFNAAAGDLRVGDALFVRADTDGTPAAGLMSVVSNTGGVVDVADMVSLTGTDTD